MAALHLLQRATALRFELRLALNADRPTESINIMWQEYQGGTGSGLIG